MRSLTTEAEATWGIERAGDIREIIIATAEAIWQVFQHPLDLTEEMPE